MLYNFRNFFFPLMRSLKETECGGSCCELLGLYYPGWCSDFFRFTVVIVHHRQRLFITRFVQPLAKLHPAEAECLGVCVTACQEFE